MKKKVVDVQKKSSTWHRIREAKQKASALEYSREERRYETESQMYSEE